MLRRGETGTSVARSIVIVNFFVETSCQIINQESVHFGRGFFEKFFFQDIHFFVSFVEGLNSIFVGGCIGVFGAVTTVAVEIVDGLQLVSSPGEANLKGEHGDYQAEHDSFLKLPT